MSSSNSNSQNRSKEDVRPSFIEISQFSLESIRPNDEGGFKAERLYQKCELKALRGEVVVILGPSGAGKSLLTNYLLNLVSPLSETLLINEGHTQTSPSMKLYLDETQPQEGIEVLQSPFPKELEGRVGVMFQALGLLEDLTVRENLLFANDQAQNPKTGPDWERWLKETLHSLKLSDTLLAEPVSKLSGGQRQRVALGRMLAYQPEIMIYDEPTSALDPLSATQAVQLIRQTHDQRNCALTLVITHDYDNFLEIADRVWFLSQDRLFFDESPPASAHEYQSRLAQPRLPASRPLSEEDHIRHQAYCRDQHFQTLGVRTQDLLKKATTSLTSSWFIRYLLNFMSRIIWQGLPFHLLAGLGLGAVATYFSFNLELGSVAIEDVGSVEVSRFVLPTFFEQMLSGFGVVLYRALIPLFTCICVAARAGTAVTAYLSDMRDEGRRQWDAMNQFGVAPLLFFLPQFMICFSLGCFILSYLAFWSASLGSLLVSIATNPLCTFYTWKATYWAGLHPQAWFWFEGTPLFFIKTALSGMCIAFISTYYGTKKRSTSIETMTNLSRANVMNVLVILMVFFLLLLLESP